MRTGKLLKLIDHQSDLIEKLREENENLIFSRDSYYKNVVDNNDYYILLDIDPVKIKNVFNVHENGYLGYSKKEFINNVYEFESDVMFPQKDIKLILEEHYKRLAIADSLDIEHFDISDHILYKMKNKGNRWGYFIKYYDLEMNSINTYVKFLDFVS